MPELSELKISLTLTIGEFTELVALLNVASTSFPEGHAPEIIADIDEMYYQLMENLEQDGMLGDFEPE